MVSFILLSIFKVISILLLVLLIFFGVFVFLISKKTIWRLVGGSLIIIAIAGIILIIWPYITAEIMRSLLIDGGIFLGIGLVIFGAIALSAYDSTRPWAALIFFLLDALKTVLVGIITGLLVLILASGLFLGVWFDSASYGTIKNACIIVWGVLTALFGIIEVWSEYADNDSFHLDLILKIAYPVLTGCITGIVIGFRTAGVRPAIIGFIVGGIIGFVSAIKDIFSSDD